MKIGIDAGGTLLKIAYIDGNARRLEKQPTLAIDSLIDMLNSNHENDDIYITGGKAEYMAQKLAMPVHLSIEFDATFNGLKTLMDEQGYTIDKFVYLNVGTGTSFHQADGNTQQRVGGSGVGGGTLTGLARLITGVDEFNEIVKLAKDGNRDAIDLKVHHIYAGHESPIPKDLTASNFGNVEAGDREEADDADELQAVIGLVAETVSAVGITLADGFDTTDIVFIGSTLLDNDVMTGIIHRYVRLKGMTPHIIESGEFSGAIGAMMTQTE